MTDRRALRSNGRVAHVDLKGAVTAQTFVQPVRTVIGTQTAPLWQAPGGAIDRTLKFGDVFHLLEDGPFAFGYADHDGFVGYVETQRLWREAPQATHVISQRHSLALDAPDFKAGGDHVPLTHGASVHVLQQRDRWARIATKTGKDKWLPQAHLRPIAQAESDPVRVAERLLGTPYQWGGNTFFGIDCSGLVQESCRACAIPCPGDSDQQERSLGETLPAGSPYQRGDLLFWKGHVAWVAGPDLLLHANAYHMAVAFEPITEAIARISAQGDGPVTRHARLPQCGVQGAPAV